MYIDSSIYFPNSVLGAAITEEMDEYSPFQKALYVKRKGKKEMRDKHGSNVSYRTSLIYN